MNILINSIRENYKLALQNHTDDKKIRLQRIDYLAIHKGGGIGIYTNELELTDDSIEIVFAVYVYTMVNGTYWNNGYTKMLGVFYTDGTVRNYHEGKKWKFRIQSSKVRSAYGWSLKAIEAEFIYLKDDSITIRLTQGMPFKRIVEIFNYLDDNCTTLSEGQIVIHFVNKIVNIELEKNSVIKALLKQL